MSKPNRIVIESKYGGPVGEKKFFMDIQEHILDGYRIAVNGTNKDATMRNYLGFMGRACLYLEGTEPVKAKPKPVVAPIEPKVEPKVEPIVKPVTPPVTPSEEPTTKVDEDKADPAPESKTDEDAAKPKEVYDAEVIDLITKKEPLLEYAEKIGMVIPTKMKIPAQIKKYIKNNQPA